MHTLGAILEGQNKIMSEIDDLNKADADLAAAVAANTAATGAAAAEIGNLTARIADNPGDSAAVEAAAKAIEAQVATITQNTAALASAGTQSAGPPAEITVSPDSFVATAGSSLNDVIQASGGVGNITFAAGEANGLTVTNAGNSTAVIGGTAPVAGGNATIDVSYADEAIPPTEGVATITVTGQ